jgi:hypothetical protein
MAAVRVTRVSLASLDLGILTHRVTAGHTSNGLVALNRRSIGDHLERRHLQRGRRTCEEQSGGVRVATGFDTSTSMPCPCWLTAR